MKGWLHKRKLQRSMQEYEKMTKTYYEWRTNQEMERRVLFDKQDADVAMRAVGQILDREQKQDLMVLENIIQRGMDRETQGLDTGSVNADMLAELEKLKQVLRDQTKQYTLTDRKWKLEHFLKDLIAGTKVAYKAADALEGTNVKAYDKASLIAQYEPDRFETSADYKEARVARAAALAVQNAADNLKEKAIAIAPAVTGVGHDLVMADFAEKRSPKLSRHWPVLLAADFAKMGKTAMKVNWAPISDKADTLREAADQAVVANEKYYSHMEHRKNLGYQSWTFPME